VGLASHIRVAWILMLELDVNLGVEVAAFVLHSRSCTIRSVRLTQEAFEPILLLGAALESELRSYGVCVH
jgi:hypothetical protein